MDGARPAANRKKSEWGHVGSMTSGVGIGVGIASSSGSGSGIIRDCGHGNPALAPSGTFDAPCDRDMFMDRKQTGSVR